MQNSQRHQQSSCRVTLLRVTRRTSGAEVSSSAAASPAPAALSCKTSCVWGGCCEAAGLPYSRMLPLNGTFYICEGASQSLGPPWHEFRPEWCLQYTGRRGKVAVKYLQIWRIRENTGICVWRWTPSSFFWCTEPAKHEVFQVWKKDRGITVTLCPSHPAQQLIGHGLVVELRDGWTRS